MWSYVGWSYKPGTGGLISHIWSYVGRSYKPGMGGLISQELWSYEPHGLMYGGLIKQDPLFL